jgi:hypothetical protein
MKKNHIHQANRKRLKSQREKILAWLEKGRTITTLQAILNFGCTRLSARIFEISDMGHVIQKKSVRTPTGVVVTQYSLIQYKSAAHEKDVFRKTKRSKVAEKAAGGDATRWV